MASTTFVDNVGPAINAAWLNDMDAHVYGVKRYGALGSGSGDDSAAINAAITAANTAGGGVVYFPAGNYRITSGITLKSDVLLYTDTKAKITWAGGVATVFTSSTSGILSRAGIIGLDIISDTASAVLSPNSAIFCTFKNIKVTGNSATQVVLYLQSNTAGSTNTFGNRNTAFNVFDNIISDGTVGTGLKLEGDGPTNGPAVNVITLNNFSNLQFAGCSVRGFEFAEWADNNYFSGLCYAYLIANNAVGCEFNTADTVGNRGVYANNFDHLAIDTFAGLTGRVALKLNWCKNIVINNFYNEPVAEGGDVVASANALSYRIIHNQGGTNSIYVREVGTARTNGLILGQSTSTDTVALEIGTGRTGSGISHIDLVGDTTYTDYGARLARQGGANAATQLIHRGTGNLELSTTDASGGLTLASSSGVKVALNTTGLAFQGSSPIAKPTVTGSRGGNAALASLLTALANYGLITDSSS